MLTRNILEIDQGLDPIDTKVVKNKSLLWQSVGLVITINK